MKNILSLGVMFISLLVLSIFTTAIAAADTTTDIPVTVEWVKVDGDKLNTGENDIDNVDRGQEIEVKVKVRATESVDDIQVEAEIRGSDLKQQMSDITRSFDLSENGTRTKTLRLRLPDRLEQGIDGDDGRFALRITVADKFSGAVIETYDIRIRSERHSVVIRDVILNPENEIRAGRTLLASLRLKNMGEKDEEGVKIRVSIPELGISASDYVQEINRENDEDDQATSPQVFLRIPDQTPTGEYTVLTEAFFDDLDEVVSEETTLRIVGQRATEAPSEGKTVINVPTVKQALTAGGSELFYPITISNMGSESKTYSVSVDSLAWGTSRVSPVPFDIVNAGESKTFNVHVSANSEAQGDQLFLVTIKSGDKVLKQIPLTAAISGSEKSGFGLTRILEVLAVVFVVLIIIILLVFGLSRVTRRDDDEDKEDEAYY